MCATLLLPQPAIAAEQTLDPVLAAAHDRWMAECDRALGPVSDPNATFFQRWAAVRYLGDRFRDRLELEQALLKCLHPFLTAELKARLAMQVDRLAQLHEDLNQLAQRRGTAREVAHTARDLLEALRRWYAEIEFAAGDIRQSDLSGKGTQVLARFRGGVWADACWIH